ncbi:BadF/BadG/BcrA/BcrD ATPase family protein [Arthrobacter russicus]
MGTVSAEAGHAAAVRAVLAVDGGGSKTDVVLLSLDGELLARERGPGSNPQITGLAESVSVIEILVGKALARTSVELAGSSVYLAGMDLPAEITAFREAVSEAPWFREDSVVEVDLLALLRAGTSEPDAVAVVCGTGINAVGVRADGATSRFPSLGRISGDWGGGGDLGAEVLWHAVRAEDGRGPQTELRDLVLAEFSVVSVAEVFEALHFGRIPGRAVVELAPLLFTAAASGDQVAAAVVARQAEEIVTMAVTSLRRLGLIEEPVPVVLGGSVLAAGHRELLNAVERGLALRAPKAHTELVTASPVLGAGLLALEHAGAGRNALLRAEAALTG